MAFFDEEQNEILLFEETPWNRHNHNHNHNHNKNTTDDHLGEEEVMMEQLLTMTRPNLVLVSKKIVSHNEPLLELLTTAATTTQTATATATTEGGGERPSEPGVASEFQASTAATEIPYRQIKSADLEINACRGLILQKLQVLTLLRQQQQQQQRSNHYDPRRQFQTSNSNHTNLRTFQPSAYHSIASLVDFDCKAQVQSLGALLSFLQNTIFRLHDGGLVTINDMRTISSSLDDGNNSMYMHLSPATYTALHIFATEHHPNLAKGNGNSKEGFSLFSLLDRTQTHGGRQLLREWMLRPLQDITKINQRQAVVEHFTQPALQAIAGGLLQLLKQVGPVDSILARLQKVAANPLDFGTLHKSLTAAIHIAQELVLHHKEDDIVFFDTTENAGAGGATAGTGPSSMNDSSSIHNDNNDNHSMALLGSILDRCHVEVLDDLSARIASTVDEEATREYGQGVVIRRGFHEQLDAWKDQYEQLEGEYGILSYHIRRYYLCMVERCCWHHDLIPFICSVIPSLFCLSVSIVSLLLLLLHHADIMERCGRDLQDRYPVLNNKLSVVFVPQVGFLVALPKEIVFGGGGSGVLGEPAPAAIELDQDFTHVFNQDGEAFFKNTDTMEMDQNIGDLDGFIKDTEGIIVSDLEESILDHEVELRETFKALSELDCLLSFASCAVDFNYTRPTMVEKERNTVYIKEGRHPLQEIISEGTFVSNFSRIDNKDRLNIITGPNFSGKSCYMRQVGIMVFMAHLGCFIPCSKAIISVTDRIFARISAIESCTVPQSSFQLDLTEMAAILRKSTKHSLVLIDEFGKGTSPASGIAVLVAALQTLADVGSKVVCTTHFLEIFSLGLLEEKKDVVRPFRMAMHLPNSNSNDAYPLFRLEEGVSASSAGLICAEKAGLEAGILDRAAEIISAIKDGRSIQTVTARDRQNISFTGDEQSMFRTLLGVQDWDNANPSDVRDMILAVARV